MFSLFQPVLQYLPQFGKARLQSMDARNALDLTRQIKGQTGQAHLCTLASYLSIRREDPHYRTHLRS